MTNSRYRIAILGWTGAVGGACVSHLLKSDAVESLLLLGRRKDETLSAKKVIQQIIDIFDPASYGDLLWDLDTAICTLGVGQPSKISKEDFIKIDKTAVLDFAKVCKQSGVKHFQLLASVGSNSKSSSFYLKTKGELIDRLVDMDFDRLSIFQPSMIITPKNRYGFTQALTLLLWPIIDKLFFGPLKKFKGIKISDLGKAFANNTFNEGKGYEVLEWEGFQTLR